MTSRGLLRRSGLGPWWSLAPQWQLWELTFEGGVSWHRACSTLHVSYIDGAVVKTFVAASIATFLKFYRYRFRFRCRYRSVFSAIDYHSYQDSLVATYRSTQG